MLKIKTKVYLNLVALKKYSKYLRTTDSVLFTENGFLNFSRQLIIPEKGVFEGTPTIFFGSFLKELLKENRDWVEISFKERLGKIVAVVLKENPENEWDREIVDFSALLVPDAVLKIPDKKNGKLVSSSALRYLLMFSDSPINFDGDKAFAYPFFQEAIVKFPNPFKGLKGYVDRPAFKELNKFKSAMLTWKKEGDTLYVSNGVVFFQKLENPEKVDFPELPKEGWIKVNPKLLCKALEDTHEWFKPYKLHLGKGRIKIKNDNNGNKLKTIEIPYYGKTKIEEINLTTDFLSYLKPFKISPMVEINFAEKYVFLRYHKLEAVFKKAYPMEGNF